MVATIALLSLAAGASRAEADPATDGAASLATSAFDPPLGVRHVDIGDAGTVPPQRKEVRCSDYPTFTVKEVDEREVGAAQLSILPSTPAHPPPCQRGNLPGERIVDANAWSGYFAGAHGDFAIFRAGDGENGGMGFAVVRASDAAIVYTAVAAGALSFSTDATGATVLHFEAMHAGACSVELKGSACAVRIGHEVGIPAPDVALCHHGYEAAKRPEAQRWCAAHEPRARNCLAKRIAGMADDDASPSVVTFQMEVVLGPAGAAARATSPAFVCWPAE